MSLRMRPVCTFQVPAGPRGSCGVDDGRSADTASLTAGRNLLANLRLPPGAADSGHLPESGVVLGRRLPVPATARAIAVPWLVRCATGQQRHGGARAPASIMMAIPAGFPHSVCTQLPP